MLLLMLRCGLSLFVGRGDKCIDKGLVHAPMRELVKIRPHSVLARHVLMKGGKFPLVMGTPVN